MKKAEKNTKSKNNELFSKVDYLIMATTIALCLGLEMAAVLPVVQDKIYETKYNKLIEQGHTKNCAMFNAQAQTQAAKESLFFAGLGAGFIGIGALRIKKSMEIERQFKRIKSEYSR